MLLRSVNSKDRVSRTTFWARRGLGHNEGSYYKCLYCNTGRTISDFDFYDKPVFTSLDQDAFDKFRSRPDSWHSILDFYCTGCRTPVRIIFDYEETQRTIGFFTVETIIEVVK